MREQLVALVRKATECRLSQMNLSRKGPDTYPDPTKTSYNDMVAWEVILTFGSGYFEGALVWFKGTWTVPHGRDGNNVYLDTVYSDAFKEFPIEQAVDMFLSNTIPEWANKE